MSKERTLLLRKDFPAVSSAEWEQAVRNDLRAQRANGSAPPAPEGADISRLYWTTDEGITVKPFYRAEDLQDLGQQLELAQTRATNDWSIRQTIAVADPRQANTAARDAIAAGAEAICFESAPENSALRGVAIQSAEDMRALIAGLPRTAPLSFRARQAARPLLLLYLSQLKQPALAPAEVLGSIDFDPLGDLLLDGGSPGYTPASATAALAGDPAWAQQLFADSARLLQFAATKAPKMRTLAVRGWQIPEAGGTVVQELAFALAHGVEYLSRLSEQGLSPDEICARIFFVFSISSNYFFEIAKLRAFRPLWALAVEQFKPTRPDSANAVVEGITSRWCTTVYDAYNNLLRGATGAMSAAIGGCDTIEITPFDIAYKPADDFSRRLSRNAQIILKHEAYLDRVVDPGAGSYYIETLTASLAGEAWKLFQKVEGEGGFLQAIRSGFVQRQVKEARKRKDDAIATRRRILLGTNQYPQPNEQALDKLDQKSNLTPLRLSGAKPASTPAGLVEQFAKGLTLGDCLAASADVRQASGQPGLRVEKLIPYRAAESFEALRLRSERRARSSPTAAEDPGLPPQPAKSGRAGDPGAKAGRRPRVLLLEYGEPKIRRARVDFSQNFFATAGFEIVTEFAGSSSESAPADAKKAAAGDPEAAAKIVAERDPDLVVLCSADQQYTAMARPLIERLRTVASRREPRAKPLPVIVAGYPEAAIEQLKRDGVADFIHIRSNAVQVLTHWQQQLGMEE
jgi:methylmalonyl-CoA mutase